MGGQKDSSAPQVPMCQHLLAAEDAVQELERVRLGGGVA